jgi:hypothetical protein
MSSNKSARLVLRTIDIQNNDDKSIRDFDNAIGTTRSNGGWVLWKNINMKQVLGSLWDKYTMFNLCLRNIVKQTGVGSNNNAGCSIWVSGLNWVNSNYNVVTKSLDNQACVGGANFLTIGGTTAPTSTVIHQFGNTAMFRKGKPIVDLTIELKNSTNFVSGGRSEKINLPLGHYEYVFEIYGVKGYETDISETEIPTHNVVSKDTSNNRFYVN